MILHFKAIFFVILFLMSTHGYGAVLLRKVPYMGWAFNATVGVAVLIVIGGFLSMFCLAYPVTLLVLFLTGILITLLCIMMQIRLSEGQFKRRIYSAIRINRLRFFEDLPVNSFLLVCSGYIIFFLMPTYVYNYHDDFHTYFDRIVQILQTGAIQENPFSLLGVDSLGGQAFMQGFAILFFDIRYINTFDAVICFILCLAMIAKLGRIAGVRPSGICLAMALFCLMDPIWVNVSALYSGSLMAIGLFFAFYIQEEKQNANTVDPIGVIAIDTLPISLFFVALLTLKATLIPFGVVFVFLYYGGEYRFRRNKRHTLKAFVLFISLSSSLVLPWLVSLSPKYFKLMDSLHALNKNHFIGSLKAELNSKSFFSLFDVSRILWDISFGECLFVIAIMTCFWGYVAYRLFVNQEERKEHAKRLVSIFFGAFLFSFIFLGNVLPPKQTYRYLNPFTIIGLPISTLFMVRFLMDSTANGNVKDFIRIPMAILLVSSILSGILLGDTFWGRYQKIRQQHHMLSFAINDQYIRYNFFAMSFFRKKELLAAQAKASQNAKILAWVATPFHLDFIRNRLIILKKLSTPWSRMPMKMNLRNIVQYFKQDLKIDYILWERNGYGVKGVEYYERTKKIGTRDSRESEMCIGLMNVLNRMIEQEKIIRYQKDNIVLLDLNRL